MVVCSFKKGFCPFGSACKGEHLEPTSTDNNITTNMKNNKASDANMTVAKSSSIKTMEKPANNNNTLFGNGNSTTTSPGTILTKSLTTTNTTIKALNNKKSNIFGGAAGIAFQQQQQVQKFTFEQTPVPASFVFGGSSDSNAHESENQEKIVISEVASKWPDDHHISKQIDKSIMDLILVDMLPYNIVEGSAFKRLEFANPTESNQYRKKTEQFFRTSLMPETFNKVQQKVVAILESAKWISIAVNISSSPNSLQSMLSFTAYFLHEASRKKIILGASVLEKDYKELYIAEQLSKIVTNFKLEQKLHLVVCENPLNIEANMQLANIKCVAHNMQLVISDAILSDKHIQAVIIKCRGIVKHFEYYKDAKENLKIIQEMLSLDEFAFVLDMDNTWLSTYLMVERINEQRKAVEVYSKEHGGIEILSPEEWDLLNDIVETLENFYEAFIDLSADNASVSLVIPLIDMLASSIEDDDSAVYKFKDELKKALNNRFKFIETSLFLIVATLLDPRFKNKYLNETQIQLAEKEMSDFINKSRSSDVIKRAQKSKNKLWEKHDNMSSAIKTNISFKRELELYLQEPLTPRKSNIYEYWDKSAYENLKTVALKYISAPPTSVESEELFTAAGKLYADRSEHLKGMEAEQFLFCHYNIKLFDFVY
ncbi:zinc finger BED domain-containing protein 4-like [Calliphora vicina]|uniref:zinc finger BED domain-containing protein 4-like n=1 Tax=Calliphora vicina TaxID=7373 RepID=UPI00325B9E11